MNKNNRLNEVFNNSERIEFNNDDCIVFFSDVHRGNNSLADEFAHNQIIYFHALSHYYDAGFTYVELGDGDDIMKFKFIDILRDSHEHIYEMLEKFHLEGRFHYIYGNHDFAYRNPDTLLKKSKEQLHFHQGNQDNLFLDFPVSEGKVFSHQESGLNFFVTHGHQGETLNDKLPWLTQFLLRNFWRPLQLIGIQDPTSVGRNKYKSKNIEKKLIDWVAANNQPMICGHTHQEHFPEKNEPPYFNTGSCVHPRWITCIEIKKGRISLVRWHIKPRKKGSLYVKRKVINGPKNIDSLLKQDSAEIKLENNQK
ncbi:MAG: hypothetical protein JEZ06_22015 [Anaerolineaceae bacterium]|nr:hypothetical protein [Anaerolineaceae bacterium]